jgi:hypothetical protein
MALRSYNLQTAICLPLHLLIAKRDKISVGFPRSGRNGNNVNTRVRMQHQVQVRPAGFHREVPEEKKIGPTAARRPARKSRGPPGLRLPLFQVPQSPSLRDPARSSGVGDTSFFGQVGLGRGRGRKINLSA